MQLTPCKICGAPCKVQTRGLMGAGDYYVDRIDDPPLWPFGPHRDEKTGESRRDYHTMVETDDATKQDIRFSCTACNHHTPWMRDAAQMLGLLPEWQ